MKNKLKSIVVDYNLEASNIERLKKIYLDADTVYGLIPNKYSKSKFKHLYNKNFYSKVVDEFGDYVNEELKHNYKETNLKELSVLDYFEPHTKNPLFFLFFVREIKGIYSNHKIVVITSNKVIKILKGMCDFLKLSNVEIIYNHKVELNLKFFKSILIPRNKITFIFANSLSSLFFLYRLLVFKLKYRTNAPEKIDILYVLTEFRCWTRQKNGTFFDYYYANSFHKIVSESSLKVWCLTFDITFDKDLVSYSMFNYINLHSLFGVFFNSIRDFFKLLPYLKNIWMLRERSLLRKIFFMKNLEFLLNSLEPKAVIFKEEVYSIGRMISLILNKLNIDSYGFQHATVTYFHPTYKNLKLYKEIPELFPKYFFIYGSYSENLFSNYGYPKDRMIKIGFDRIEFNNIYRITQKPKDKVKVLFIGGFEWFNELFGELYQKMHKFPIEKIFFRPHPGLLLNFNVKKFLNQYPDAVLIDPNTLDSDDNIREVDCVIGLSTCLLNAIYQRKITVSWQPYGLEDFYDLRYWGAQIVESLEGIDWKKKSNPDNVIREIKPEVNFVKFLEKLPQSVKN